MATDLHLALCMIKMFRGGGVVDGEGVAVKDACSGMVGVGGH